MPEQAVQRKLAAILAADIAGYGRLLGVREHRRHAVTSPDCRVLKLGRRDLFGVIAGGAAVLTPLWVRAAEPVHIGFVSGGDQKGAADFLAALRDGLSAESYREPDTLKLDIRYADWSLDPGSGAGGRVGKAEGNPDRHTCGGNAYRGEGVSNGAGCL